jgi:hypothetical protein
LGILKPRKIRRFEGPTFQSLVKYEAFEAPTVKNLVKYEALSGPNHQNLVKLDAFHAFFATPWSPPAFGSLFGGFRLGPYFGPHFKNLEVLQGVPFGGAFFGGNLLSFGQEKKGRHQK